MVQISILLVNYNSLEYLRRCLKDVFGDESVALKDVIVVDNASTDGSVEFVQKEYPQVRLLHNKENVGFGRANNQGLKVAKYDRVLLLNPDTSLTPGTLEGLCRAFASHNQVGALGCRLLNSDGSLQFSFGNFPSLRRTIFDRVPILRQSFGYLCRDPKRYCVAQPVGWVTGACVLLDHTAVMKIGGFDEEFFLYTEEVDLLYRLRRSGYKVIYDPSVNVTHHYEGGSPARFSRKRHYMRQSLLLYLKKHRPWWEYRLFQFLVTMGV